eukprot:g72473.t1
MSLPTARPSSYADSDIELSPADRQLALQTGMVPRAGSAASQDPGSAPSLTRLLTAQDLARAGSSQTPEDFGVEALPLDDKAVMPSLRHPSSSSEAGRAEQGGKGPWMEMLEEEQQQHEEGKRRRRSDKTGRRGRSGEGGVGWAASLLHKERRSQRSKQSPASVAIHLPSSSSAVMASAASSSSVGASGLDHKGLQPPPSVSGAANGTLSRQSSTQSTAGPFRQWSSFEASLGGLAEARGVSTAQRSAPQLIGEGRIRRDVAERFKGLPPFLHAIVCALVQPIQQEHDLHVDLAASSPLAGPLPAGASAAVGSGLNGVNSAVAGVGLGLGPAGVSSPQLTSPRSPSNALLGVQQAPRPGQEATLLTGRPMRGGSKESLTSIEAVTGLNRPSPSHGMLHNSTACRHVLLDLTGDLRMQPAHGTGAAPSGSKGSSNSSAGGAGAAATGTFQQLNELQHMAKVLAGLLNVSCSYLVCGPHTQPNHLYRASSSSGYALPPPSSQPVTPSSTSPSKSERDLPPPAVPTNTLPDIMRVSTPPSSTHTLAPRTSPVPFNRANTEYSLRGASKSARQASFVLQANKAKEQQERPRGGATSPKKRSVKASRFGWPFKEEEEGRRQFHRGPIFCELMLLHQLHLAPSHTQSVLLQAMKMHKISISGTEHDLPSSHIVVATHSRESSACLSRGLIDQFLLEVLPVVLPQPNTPQSFTLLHKTLRHKYKQPYPSSSSSSSASSASPSSSSSSFSSSSSSSSGSSYSSSSFSSSSASSSSVMPSPPRSLTTYKALRVNSESVIMPWEPTTVTVEEAAWANDVEVGPGWSVDARCLPWRLLATYLPKVFVSEGMLQYMRDIVVALRQHCQVASGPSPQGSAAFRQAAKAHALLAGVGYVRPLDVDAVAADVLSHRITLRGAAFSLSRASRLHSSKDHPHSLLHRTARVIVENVLRNFRPPKCHLGDLGLGKRNYLGTGKRELSESWTTSVDNAAPRTFYTEKKGVSAGKHKSTVKKGG